MADCTLGIDLASQPENTAVCLLIWQEDRVEVPYLACGRDRDGQRMDDPWLLHLMLNGLGAAPAKIGIDAPLGWPVAFVEAVADLDAWPLVDEQGRRRLTTRCTDRWIRAETGKTPLSVSADRIAYPAMRAVGLVRRFQDATAGRIDRSGVTGPVAEVYPDTAVTRFGLRGDEPPRVSYKGSDGREVRARMLGRLHDQAPWLELSASQRADCVAADDPFDALIAALLARSVQCGLTCPPPPEHAAEAAAEGWIHLPRNTGLDDLAPPGISCADGRAPR